MKARLQRLVGDAPLYPLVILFGLNAVDELDRSAFAILAPEIRDEFGLGFAGLLTLIALVVAASLALQVPIAGLADRTNRVRLAMSGAVLWAVFSFLTGFAGGIVFLGFMRAGSAIGKAVNDPTHNSLLADWYAPDNRPAVFSMHRMGNAVGQIVGPLMAGFLAYYFGWRTPFFIFAVPTLILVVLAVRLREPVRGNHERRVAGASEEAINTEEVAPSYAEAWRLCWKVETLRRIFAALPFLGASLTGFGALGALYYEEIYGLSERGRGILAASIEPAQIAGLVAGAVIGNRLVARDPKLALMFLAWSSAAAAVFLALFALAPSLWMSVAMNVGIAFTLSIVGPGVLAALSLAIPPRARSMGFSMGSLWLLPGLLVLPLIGWIADNWGIRTGMVVMTPIFLIGSQILASARHKITSDIEEVQRSTAARSEVLLARQRGEAKLLVCRDVEVSYGSVQVLFGVDLDVDEGEIVALLGTNGAGKSTLLKAISGVAEADKGAIVFDGRDITHAPPNEIAVLGVSQLPGGNAVFGSLTVAENLQAAQWMHTNDAEGATIEEVLEIFPALTERMHNKAADLSGGQQQMLGLGMVLLIKPRLLMIDELTLGLAPTVVEQLLPVVGRLRDEGVTIILVEQSVNVALTIADRAYFMEKGEIQFEGPTKDLLNRPDILRSVFLQSAAEPEIDLTAEPPVTTAPHVNEKPLGDTPEPAPPILEVRSLSRSFGGIRAVDDVSFTVSPGEILGVIGPNGAGKTTLFDLISDFTPAHTGSVFLDGRDITNLPAHGRAKAGLGRSFQDARLFPSLTVEETLSVALERFVAAGDPISAALHLPNIYDAEQDVRRRVNELIEMLNLEAFRTKFIGELSTGSRRVVDLACVVAHRPLVVLLDEPSSGIAQREAEALVPLLQRIRTEMGSAMVVIEHDMALLSSLADRMLALDQGAVVTSGPPQQVLTDDRVVAAYLGGNEAAIARSGPN